MTGGGKIRSKSAKKQQFGSSYAAGSSSRPET